MFEALPLILFALVFVLILFGYPVAFTLGGLSILMGVIIFDVDFFYLLSLRISGTMSNFVLIAVPLFVYMGIMLEKSGLAESLLETMALLFGKFKGGLAISVVIVGAMLAASTGIVGATVITMGLISLPTMLKRGYSAELATGTIASAGTLGQIIPPSVVLVLLGSVLNVSVGDLFKAAILPGLALVLIYLAYIIIYSRLNPEKAPCMPDEAIAKFREKGMAGRIIKAFLLPFVLILAVLGSIFAGIASPTEAAGVGALGATMLTIIQGKFTKNVHKEVMKETMYLTCMVFIILIGATAFSLVFRGLGGDRYLIELIQEANLTPAYFLIMVMVAVFIAGFFIDFIEIIFIFVPVVAPIFSALGIDLIWIGILLALNLQTSFLTPPFGFALFYLKGVAPEGVTTSQIYKGILPFVLIQIVFLALVLMFPEIVV
ncbi:MAG: TRAP transporter large permease subunit [Cyclobacteriaceae bacterium]